MMGCNPACDCIKKWSANGKSSAFPATKDTFSCPFCFIKTFAFSNICSVKSSATTSSNMGANIFATCPPPVATSRRRLLWRDSTCWTTYCKSSPLACILLFTYLSALLPNCFSQALLYSYYHLLSIVIYIYDSYNYYNSLHVFSNPLFISLLITFSYNQNNMIIRYFIKQKRLRELAPNLTKYLLHFYFFIYIYII